MEKLYRYMVTWGSECTYVTAASKFEAMKQACDEWNVRWQGIAEEISILPLREMKARPAVW